ncbi:unnamed protein product, partial [marine sediment metagenome]
IDNTGAGTSTNKTYKVQYDHNDGRWTDLAFGGAPSSNSGATTSDWNATTVDAGGNVGEYPSIAIGTDGYPVISYYNASTIALMVAKCNNADCTAVSTTTLDSGGDVGQYTSIAIGTDGYPVISYYDNTLRALKVYHCTTTDCSGGNAYIVDDPDNYVGKVTSIAIGTDGYPVISYLDSSAKDLKVFHCTSTDCSGGEAYTVATVGTTFIYVDQTSIAIGNDGYPVISYSNSVD